MRNSPSKPLASPWWVVAGSLLGLTVGNGPVMQFTFGVFVKPLSEALQTDRGTISGALLAGLVATGIATPLIGRLIDQHGTRRVALPAIVLFALGMAAIGLFANSPAALILMYALCGIVAAGQTPLPYSKAIAAVFDERRGLALGIATAGVGLGTMLMPMLAQKLMASFGWRGAYMGLGLVTLLVALPAMAGLVTRRREAATSADGTAAGPAHATPNAMAPGMSAAEARVSGRFWCLAVAFFTVALAASGVVAHIVPLMTDRGVPAASAAAAISATVCDSIDGNTHAFAENKAPNPMAHVNGILTTLFNACHPALRTPWCCAWSMRDMAMHTELVKNTSTKMVTIALPTAAGPSRFNSSGKPM